jgi:hypothetical protein
MNPKQSVFYALIALVVVCLPGWVTGQQVEKNLEIGEMVRIAAAYHERPYLSFDTRVVISDSSYTCCDGNNLPQADTLRGQYKLREGRYWAQIDSVEYLQGFMYNLALYHQEKLIAVGKPSFDNRIMQLSVLDSTFQQAHVKSLSITEAGNNIRLFVIEFLKESPYSRYELRYNKNDYLISEVTYFLKNGYNRENGSTSTARIQATFSNYSTSEFSSDYFLEEKYIYKDRDGFKTRQGYTGYQIITTDDDL